MATATSAKSALTSGLPRAPRQPSPFHPTVKVTIMAHGSVGDGDTSLSAIRDLLETSYLGDYAVRAVHRTRAVGSSDKVPSLSVYVAPKGYEFAKEAAASGVRLDSETADVLFAAAKSMGIDTSNRKAAIDAVARALATKLQHK